MDTAKHIIFDIIGLPAVLLGFILNLDNLNSFFLAVGGLIYLAFKIYGIHLDNRLKETKLTRKELNEKHNEDPESH